jgi:molybdate transport system substrate-binding protein
MFVQIQRPTLPREKFPMLRALTAFVLMLIALPHARADQPMRLFAAGSLTAAMTDMLSQSGLPQNELAPPTFGPSGLLRERIEAGDPADVFASADMAQPRRLAAERGGIPVIMFTRNSLCALGKPELGLTPENVLERMLDPAVRLGTSTPGADPGGDYAWAVFARGGHTPGRQGVA